VRCAPHAVRAFCAMRTRFAPQKYALRHKNTLSRRLSGAPFARFFAFAAV